MHAEALRRGYSFDRRKIGAARCDAPIRVTRGQLAYEWEHLLRKLARRSPELYVRWRALPSPRCHPLMRRCAGPVEAWEHPFE